MMSSDDGEFRGKETRGREVQRRQQPVRVSADTNKSSAESVVVSYQISYSSLELYPTV